MAARFAMIVKVSEFSGPSTFFTQIQNIQPQLPSLLILSMVCVCSSRYLGVLALHSFMHIQEFQPQLHHLLIFSLVWVWSCKTCHDVLAPALLYANAGLSASAPQPPYISLVLNIWLQDLPYWSRYVDVLAQAAFDRDSAHLAAPPSLLIFSLFHIYCSKIFHAGQGIWMVWPQHSFTEIQDFQLQPSLLIFSLNWKCNYKIVHASQCISMFWPQKSFMQIQLQVLWVYKETCLLPWISMIFSVL